MIDQIPTPNERRRIEREQAQKRAAARPYDLIELHVTGGPWSQRQVDSLAQQLIDALVAVVPEGNCYVADIRGPETERDDEA